MCASIFSENFSVFYRRLFCYLIIWVMDATINHAQMKYTIKI